MNRFKFLLSTFLFFSFVFSFPALARAADLNIDCPASPTVCSKSGLDPLFSNSLDGFWYPGKSITKTFNLKNSSSETREMAINGTRTSTANILENVMNISIVGGSTVIWSGSVADFYDKDRIEMGIFTPGADLNYDFTVLMSSGADNNYQNRETVFDLTLGFWGEPVSTPSPVPGGGGTVLGASVSAPVCNDTAPGGAPTLTSAIGGVNSVTLTWTAAPDPVTYYLVTYGTIPGAQTYGNPNVGGQGVTSYTVNGLSGATTYYFRVRAGNGCMPGPFSNELSTRVGGGFIAGPAAGFIPGVLGVTTQATPGPTASATPQVLGTECVKSKFPWWIFLILEFIALLLIIRRGKINKWSVGKVIFWCIVIAVLSQIAHEIIGCNCIASIWCSKYLWINLIILLPVTAYGFYLFSRKK